MPLFRAQSSVRHGAVGAFGKLPSAHDFVRHGPLEAEAQQFVDWVERGMAWAAQRYSTAWAQQYQTGAAQAFVFRPEREVAATRRVVVGLLQPSRDAIGRLFPWVTYATLPAATLLPAPHIVCLLTGRFLQAAHAASAQLQLAPAGAGVDAWLAQLSAPEPEQAASYVAEYDQWAQTASLEAVWSSVYGHPRSSEVAAAVAAIVESVGPIRGQEPPPTRLSVRLPLGAGGPAAATLWLDLVRRAAQWTATVPTAFWSVARGSLSVLIQLGSLTDRSLAELWMPDPNSDYICDLTVPASVNAAALVGRLPPSVAEVLARPRARVVELLTAVGQ
jgi:type VI secretion system ImpM family protein